MNYVENVAAFIQHCVERELPACSPTERRREYLYNYCDHPAYDTNGLVLDVYKALGRPKAKLVHWPYWLAYCGGLCFDVLALVLRKKLPVSSIWVKKFCQDTYFTSSRVAATGFVPPVKLEDGLQKTIHHEFVAKTRSFVFQTE